MKNLYLITGPPGVGKSSISQAIASQIEKSALIDGDDIYHLVRGSYVAPWLKGNHMDIFWENCFDLIHNFLENDYDLVFNYILNPKEILCIKDEFSNLANIKFCVLMTDEASLVSRDKTRPLSQQMGERSLVLLQEFRNMSFDSRFLLDTTNLSIEEAAQKILNNSQYSL